MKRMEKLLLASALMLISTQSIADSPSFTYVGAEFVSSGVN